MFRHPREATGHVRSSKTTVVTYGPCGEHPTFMKERETKTAVSRCENTVPENSIRTACFQAIKEPTLAGQWSKIILRKEVIQPQVPLRLPCYDFTPVADLTVADCLLAVGASSSGKTDSHGVTGGVYKARERIHRGELIRDY
jgi:hypothetical protein